MDLSIIPPTLSAVILDGDVYYENIKGENVMKEEKIQTSRFSQAGLPLNFTIDFVSQYSNIVVIITGFDTVEMVDINNNERNIYKLKLSRGEYINRILAINRAGTCIAYASKERINMYNIVTKYHNEYDIDFRDFKVEFVTDDILLIRFIDTIVLLNNKSKKAVPPGIIYSDFAMGAIVIPNGIVYYKEVVTVYYPDIAKHTRIEGTAGYIDFLYMEDRNRVLIYNEQLDVTREYSISPEGIVERGDLLQVALKMYKEAAKNFKKVNPIIKQYKNGEEYPEIENISISKYPMIKNIKINNNLFGKFEEEYEEKKGLVSLKQIAKKKWGYVSREDRLKALVKKRYDYLLYWPLKEQRVEIRQWLINKIQNYTGRFLNRNIASVISSLLG